MTPSHPPQIPAALCSHHLPTSSPGVLGSLLTYLFRVVTLNRAQSELLMSLPDDALVVYVTKYSSNLEWLGAAYSYGRHGLPAPLWALNQTSFLLQTWRTRGRLAHRLLARGRDRLMGIPPEGNPNLESWLTADVAALFISLLDKKEFYRLRIKEQPDSLRQLLAWQLRSGRPTYIVPQLLLFSKSPPPQEPRLWDLVF